MWDLSLTGRYAPVDMGRYGLREPNLTVRAAVQLIDFNYFRQGERGFFGRKTKTGKLPKKDLLTNHNKEKDANHKRNT